MYYHGLNIDYILKKFEKYTKVLEEFQIDEFWDTLDKSKEFRRESLSRLHKYRNCEQAQKYPVYFWQFKQHLTKFP